MRLLFEALVLVAFVVITFSEVNEKKVVDDMVTALETKQAKAQVIHSEDVSRVRGYAEQVVEAGMASKDDYARWCEQLQTIDDYIVESGVCKTAQKEFRRVSTTLVERAAAY